MLRTTLIYPPFVSENRAFPPLSLPALTAFLRERSYPAAQIDANIEFYRWITGSSVLKELHGRLVAALASHARVPDTLLELDYYCNLSDAVHVWLPYIYMEMQGCNGDMSRLDGTQCLYILDKLSLIVGLERKNHKQPVEMTSEEMLEEIQRQDQSLLASYVRDHVVPRILDTCPDVIGMSLMVEQQLFPALMLAHYLKEKLPSLRIVMGGGLISAVADKLGKRSLAVFSLVDAFVTFDGEVALLQLLQCFERNEPLTTVPNLIFLDQSSDTVFSTAIQETGSLDDLPLPDFDGLNFNLYTRRIMPYYVSKGCSYGRCAYCSDPAYSSARNRSPFKAADEIQALVQRYQPDTVLFVDSYIHPRYMEPIAHEIVERKIKTKWVTQTRMDRFLTSNSIQLFAQSGCSELWFGMETVNERMIRLIRKGSKKEIILRILDDCWQNGIKVTLNCMIGFPTETVQEASDTMDFIDGLNQIYPELIFKCNTGFVFIPRLAAFGQTPEKFGITVVDEFEWSPRLEWIPPAWRYQERFLTLDSQMFEKSYDGTRAFRDRMNGPRAVNVSMDSTISLSRGCYLVSSTADLIALWKKVFEYQLGTVSAQRERKCREEEALQAIDSQVKSDASIQHAYGRAAFYAYVVDDGSWRKMVPLNDIYRLIISCIEPGISTREVRSRLQTLYPEHSSEEVEKALLFAVQFLAISGVIELDHVRMDKPLQSRASLVFNRRNLGHTTEEEDCDPVGPLKESCATETYSGSHESELIRIQNVH